MARVVITGAADADSDAILADLEAKAGTTVADRFEADFAALYRRLGVFPESGAPRPALGRSVRVVFVTPYVVIYRYIDDLVLVVRIVHGSRRVTRRLLSSPQ